MKKNKFDIILVFILVTLPLIIIDLESEFYQKQFLFAYLINIISFFLIGQFLNLLKTTEAIKYLLLISLSAWFCILPIIFYKIYLKNPLSFSYNSQFIGLLKNTNEENISITDSTFLRLNEQLNNEFKTKKEKDDLPRNDDKLVFYKSFIVLSPTTIRSFSGIRAPETYLSIYNRNTGTFILSLPKRETVMESYKYFSNNLKFKIDKIKNPKIGIEYFDFWCSSIIGFRDNLITPLRSWILLLDFLFISILFVPLYNFVKTIFSKKMDEQK
ncbi:MAG: hypothetical protein ABI549_13430 [Flavobacterium sp.]|uniref:hypothetical protein n=1 Tax=Flavobacterium sp. TaxID=239 RepID=UPI003262D289